MIGAAQQWLHLTGLSCAEIEVLALAQAGLGKKAQRQTRPAGELHVRTDRFALGRLTRRLISPFFDFVKSELSNYD